MRIFSKIIRKFYQKSYVAAPGALPPSWAPYKDYIAIDSTTLIAPSATIQFYNLPTPPKVMLRIGAMSHVFGHFAFVKPDAEITIGDRCQIGSSHFISGTSINVGDDVIVSWGCYFIDTDNHSISWEHRKNDAKECYADYLKNPQNMVSSREWNGVNFNPITIGNKVWIGFNSIILKNVSLAEKIVVGAGTVVSKSCSTVNAVLAGNPAKEIISESRRKFESHD